MFLRIDELCLVLAFLGIRLVQIGFERRRVDPGEDIAFVDFLSLAEIDRERSGQ